MNDPTTLPGRQKALALAGVMLGMLLAALDQTIVATAGPTMQRELHIAPSLYTWITTSYLVSSTVMVPIWGKLSDLLGRRSALLAGIGVFLFGSVLCGVSQNATQLILFRAIQGLGSASLFVSAFAIVADLFSPAERGKFQGLFGAVFGLSSVVGPLLGGFITDHLGWHWVFFINMPLGALAVGFILARMPPLKRDNAAVTLDVAGAATLALGAVPLLLALSLGRVSLREGETGFLWASWQTAALLGTAAVGIIAFLLVEVRARDPIVDLKLFSNRTFAIGAAAAFCAGLTFLGAIVFLPLFVTVVIGASATGAGLVTLPLTFGLIVGNLFSGQLVSRTGKYKPFMLIGISTTMVVFLFMGLTLTPTASYGEIAIRMFFLGTGLGPSIPLYTLVMQAAVQPAVMGAATAVGAFSRQMGATVGLALLGTVFATTLSSAIPERMAEATRDMPAPLVERMRALQSAPLSAGEEGQQRARLFDRARAVAAIEESVPPPMRATALAALDKIEAALKQAFTDAVARLFVVAGCLAVLGLLLTLALPQLPLRKGPAQRPPE